MIETLAALLVAHVAADFVFQTRWMAVNKGNMGPLAAHVAVVWAASWISLGCPACALVPVTALAAVHLAMDLAKARVLGQTGLSFGIDQGVHLLTVAAVAAAVPGAWQAGFWSTTDPIAPLLLIVGVAAMGGVFAVRGGFYFVDHIATGRAGAHRLPQIPAVPRRTLIENGIIFAAMLAVPLVAALAGLVRVVGLMWWARRHATARGCLTCYAASMGWAVCAGFGTHLILGGLVGLDATGLAAYFWA